MKTPRLADQARFWFGKAQFGLAPTAPDAEYEAKTMTPLETTRKAIEKTQQLAQRNDPDANARRREMLLELTDALQTAGLPKDPMPVCATLWNENTFPSPPGGNAATPR